MSKTPRSWQVEHRTVMQGWVNCWTHADGTPCTFSTAGGARAALSAHLESLREAGMDYSPDDFRIVKGLPT